MTGVDSRRQLRALRLSHPMRASVHDRLSLKLLRRHVHSERGELATGKSPGRLSTGTGAVATSVLLDRSSAKMPQAVRNEAGAAMQAIATLES
jgi:hypothetical protein